MDAHSMRRIIGLLLVQYLSFVSLFAQEERRLALVIGNSEYTSGKLNNAVNDANKVSAKLKTLGFDVMLYNNTSQKTMGDAINAFTDKASDYAVALFYYAGHGIQSEGSNYLIPVDDDKIEKESDLRYYSEDVNRLLARLEESGCKLKIVVLDACRNNPLCRSWHRSAASQGLAFINAPDGTLIAYATSPGSVAIDGGKAQNSPYTAAFLQMLDKTNLSILEFFNEVGGIVRRNTKNKQTPWFSTSPIEGGFKFNQSTAVENEKSVKSQASVFLTPSPGFTIGNSFIQKSEGVRYGSSTPNVSDKEYAMWSSKLVGHAIRPVLEKTGVNEVLVDNIQDSVFHTAKNEVLFTVNEVVFSMTRIAGGTFTMGATKEQVGAQEDEYPSHQVTLSDYYIGTTEVTQELYIAVMGNNPSYFTGNSRCPVEQVSKSDCQEFIKRLNELTGENFSLPTEAQWEYAARGGNFSHSNLYSGSDGIDDVAWYSKNSLGHTQEVGRKRPNQLGLYDMSGNVFEWCEDNYKEYSLEEKSNPINHGGVFEVLRGGGWNSRNTSCRISYRNAAYESVKHNYYGFRLVLNQISSFR